MTRRRNLSPAQRQRNLDQLHHRLSEQVKQLHHGQEWRAWLTIAGKFHHHYSWRNSLLIQMQDPDATTVARLQHPPSGWLGALEAGAPPARGRYATLVTRPFPP